MSVGTACGDFPRPGCLTWADGRVKPTQLCKSQIHGGSLQLAGALPIMRPGRARDEMAAVDSQSGDGAGGRDQFIPVRKTDILDALIEHGRLRAGEVQQFRRLARLLGAIYHYEYFDRLETLRNDYFYFNPDLPHDLTVDP